MSEYQAGHLSQICDVYRRRSALMKRLRRAGLIAEVR